MRLPLAESVFVVLLGISLVVFLLPGDDLSASAPNDKVMHALTFLGLALAGRWAGCRPLVLGLGLGAYAVLTEILQAVLPIDRDGDPRDVLADAGGLVLGLALGWAVHRAGARARGASD